MHNRRTFYAVQIVIPGIVIVASLVLRLIVGHRVIPSLVSDRPPVQGPRRRAASGNEPLPREW